MNRKNSKCSLSVLTDKYGGLCFWCGKPVNAHPDHEATREHLLPLALGGNNRVDNIVLAGKSCNDMRGSVLVPAWFDLVHASVSRNGAHRAAAIILMDLQRLKKNRDDRQAIKGRKTLTAKGRLRSELSKIGVRLR